MTPEPLEPEGHTGDDLCRFSWDTQITATNYGPDADERRAAELKQSERVGLLEDVARAAREHLDVCSRASGVNAELREALARLDAEGSR